MPEIRDATHADLSQICDITNEAIANTTAVWSLTPVTLDMRRAWFDARRRAGFPVLAAVDDDDEVLGFASLGEFRPWEGYVLSVENSIYVRPDAQGRGHGKALLRELVVRARRLGKHVIMAGIEAENTASIALHAGEGFQQVGRLHQVGRKFDRWLDLVFMQKMLEP